MIVVIRSLQSEILAFVKILLVANAHQLQVNPRVGLLRAFEGFSLVCGWSSQPVN
jgi:hypothetical protein